MSIPTKPRNKLSFQPSRGFSLIEVVLAIGIFLITVLALVGLLGPTLKSVDEVEKTDEVASVVNTLNAFLQSSLDIAPAGTSKFDAIYNAVVGGGEDHATIFVFRRFLDDTSTDVELVVGFREEGSVDADAELDATDFENLAGPVYRAVLSVSSVTPEVYFGGSAPTRNGDGIYTIGTTLDNYEEGYFAMEVRIFNLETDGALAANQNGQLPPVSDLEELSQIEPLFTYNTAVVR